MVPMAEGEKVQAAGAARKRQRVVIVGGGFGGLYAAQRLAKADVDVVLVDRRNFHLFQPLLYQVATGGLSPGNIASPLRAVLRKQRNAQVLQAEVTGFNLAGKRVLLKDGELEYDTLIVAAGSTPHFFGHPEWAERAPGLKTVEDALAIRSRVFAAFEAAERETDPEARRAALNFVVVGGGPTGVELAGALGELAHRTLKGEFRSFDTAETRVVLLEGGPRILPSFPERLSVEAVASLEKLGVEVRTGVQVTGMEGVELVLKAGEAEERLPARTVLWAAGMKASPLGAALTREAGAELDRMGRVVVNLDLTLPGHPDVYVVGDLANYTYGSDRPLPSVATVAMQQGEFVADRIQGRGKAAFRYVDKGSLAVIGRNAAVGQIGPWKVRGWLAWSIWSLVHVLSLVEFDNRLMVFVQWAWSYFTHNRGARLITRAEAPDPVAGENAPARKTNPVPAAAQRMPMRTR